MVRDVREGDVRERVRREGVSKHVQHSHSLRLQ